MASQKITVRALALAFAAGAWTEAGLVERAGELFHSPAPRWLRPLARRLSGRVDPDRRPSLYTLSRLIREDAGFARAWRRGRVHLDSCCLAPDLMRPARGVPERWALPQITTFPDLARLLGVDPDQLEWLTAFGPKGHYLYHLLPKSVPGSFRLVEAPKPLLKRAQRALLRGLLDRIPPHEAAHGFRPGHSVHTFVRLHTGRPFVLRMDLQDFFASVTSGRVRRLFLAAGYPEAVAEILTRLCTHATPGQVLEGQPVSWHARKRLRIPHLPQGAPTSPALANLCAFRLDCRLAGLARRAGAHYTRYADDLLFSGDAAFARQARRFHVLACAIALFEGFQVNTRKTRFLHAAQRQQAAGIVLNAHPNIARPEFDRLKAILTNCLRHGPHSQNRGSHSDLRSQLRGQVAWAESVNPDRGGRLRALFERIDWQSPAPQSRP